MPSVDNRVVKMEFDNAAFEKKIATTLTSLEKLSKAMKFEGAGKGLSDVSGAINKVDVSHISDGIEGVSKKFLALSTIAITALANITTAALHAGANIVKSLSLDNVISGFHEYETNINSIQTILANTKAQGTNLDQVNAALQQLNEYSDKTIYNFSEMARNIGTFTAAGVDLDTSVQSIKGIANLAAISGSSSEQASTAMYQLSQAISTGTLRLQDWNSVTNAGMGGEVFQKALFETGKTLGTIKDIPIDKTFEEWTAGGNSFRSSLESNWLTADVLTTTLQGFTGEMTDAELAAKGFTAEQIAQIQELGKLGVESATKVRTLTQLLGTIKESIGSGWTETFSLLVGGFEDATRLFTDFLSVPIGKFIKQNADARNAILKTWVDLGGRQVLIEGIQFAFRDLLAVLKPIKEAFRQIFPPVTAERLMTLTVAFNHFFRDLKPSEALISGIKNAFLIFFNILKIGMTVIKEAIGFVGDLIGVLLGAAGGGAGKVGGFLANIANFFSDLAKKLVQGQAISDFFSNLLDKVKKVVPLIQEFKDKIVDMFSGFDPKVPEAVSDSMGRVSDRFQTLKDVFAKVTGLWKPFADAMGKILDVLGQIWDAVSGFFSDLGKSIADAMGEGDFDKVLDVINVGLLGGIVALLTKFLKGGIKLDFGQFNLLEKLSGIFDGLTDSLKAMQTKIKADALMKIAEAIAVLTASVLVLSLIDSEALAKALGAMAVGFGQLMGAFAILNKITLGPKSAASFAILAAGMILLAAAVLILAVAAKILADLDWNELAKGLVGVTVLIAALAIAIKPLSNDPAGLISTGAGLLVLSVAINILALAVQRMGQMSWSEITKGLFGLVVGISGISTAMRLMPEDMAAKGLGLLLLSLSLKKIGEAVLQFAGFEWGTMIKGIIGIAVALAAIGLAMQLMPTNLPITAAGLLILSIALVGVQKVLQAFGSMKGGDIAKGIAALAGSLLVLAVAMTAMSGSLAGAVAITIAAVGLKILLEVLKGFIAIKLTDLLKGLLGIAIALAVLAAAALLMEPALPALALLGAALLLVGAGFALFGFGAAQVARAFALFAKVGPKGAKAFVKALEAMGEAIPAFAKGVAIGIVDMVTILGDLAPKLATALGKIIGSLIDALIPLIPKLGELIKTLLLTVMDILRAVIPEYVLLGVDIILALLQGIKDRIGDIVTVAVDIITAFIEGIANNIQSIIDAGVDLILKFIQGITDNVIKIADAAIDLVLKFIGAITDNIQQVIDAGVDLIVKFLGGITDNLQKVIDAATEVVTTFITQVGGMYLSIIQAGVDLIVDFIQGITDSAQKIIDAAFDAITTFITEIGANAGRVVTTGVSTLIKFAEGITKDMIRLANAAFDIITEFIKQLRITIDTHQEELKTQGWLLVGAIINGMTLGLAGRAKEMAQKVADFASNAVKAAKGVLRVVGDPYSLVFMGIAESMAKGMMMGLDADTTVEKSAVGLMNRTNEAFSKAVETINMTADMNPTITPVLDLSQIAADAKKIGAYIQGSNKLVPTLSLQQARAISTSATTAPDESAETTGPSKVNFEQNIFAPKQLSTADIYKQTRNQIAMAKEELSIR